MTMAGFDTRTITQEDIPRVLAFLYKFFFRDEPMNEYLEIVQNAGAMKELEKYATAPIKKFNCSLIAINEHGETIGLSLNKIRTPNEVDDMEFMDPVFTKVAGLLDLVDTEAKKVVFGKYNVEKVMQIDILSVDESCRGQGIAKKLIDMTRDIARQQGIKIIRVDCSSAYSAKAAERMGFHSVFEILYKDYKDNEGKQILKPKEPHTSVSVWIQNIEGSATSKL